VRFTPARVSLAWQAFKVVVGLGLLALLAFGARRIGGEIGIPALRAALTAAAALWGVLGAPALFARLGLSQGASLASSPRAETRVSPGVMRLRRRWR